MADESVRPATAVIIYGLVLEPAGMATLNMYVHGDFLVMLNWTALPLWKGSTGFKVVEPASRRVVDVGSELRVLPMPGWLAVGRPMLAGPMGRAVRLHHVCWRCLESMQRRTAPPVGGVPNPSASLCLWPFLQFWWEARSC
jgi:hypothetical protein